MKIDLSSVNIFEDNELELDKKITFISEKMEREYRQLQKKSRN